MTWLAVGLAAVIVVGVWWLVRLLGKWRHEEYKPWESANPERRAKKVLMRAKGMTGKQVREYEREYFRDKRERERLVRETKAAEADTKDTA